MIKIEESIVVNRPIEEVFAYIADTEKMPQWAAEVVDAKKTSEGPVGVGTTLTVAVKVLGRRVENTHEVTMFVPNSKFAFKTTSGPIPSVATETVEAVEGGTRFSIVAEAEPGGFFKLAEPIVERMIQRQWGTNIVNLKELLESQP